MKTASLINGFKKDDLRNTDIVISEKASETEKFAAGELQLYLNQSTGIEIPVVSSVSKRKIKIIIGDLACEFLPDCEKKRAEIKHDGFILHFSDDKILIFGNSHRGTLNGVYSLLHEWGFRWVFPRKGEEIIPDLYALPLTAGTRIINPDLEFRGVCIFPVHRENVEELRKIIDWMGKNRINMLMTSINRTNPRKLGWILDWQKVSDLLLPELQKRGIVLNISEHSNRYFFPTSHFEKHPEWFAMNSEGKRFSTGQMCYSNPEAVSLLVENYAKYAGEHPEVDIIGTWPEDGYGFCQCEQCREPGAVLKAVNKIAERIEQIRPDLTVEYLSYTKETSDVPPDILPRRNTAILVANIKVAEGWLRKSDKVGGRGVYQLNYHISDNSAYRASLPIRLEKTRQDCIAAKQIGSRGIIPFYIGLDTWWRSSLNLYFMTQFSWNVNKSGDELLKDFCDKYYPDIAGDSLVLFKELEKMPMANQHTPAPWPLWQEWPTIITDYTGKNWEDIRVAYASIHKLLDKCGKKCEVRTGKRLYAVGRFVESAETMLNSWHERALAVQAFDNKDAAKVRKHIMEAGRLEQGMIELINKSKETDDGVNGAWIDFVFFQNWRLQLDKQLLEMRTLEQKLPVTDENPEMELFLPGLLNL
jgi:hypothetical protein